MTILDRLSDWQFYGAMLVLVIVVLSLASRAIVRSNARLVGRAPPDF